MAVVIAVTSDQHARSTLGLIHPEGVALSDEGHYTPSKGQRWLWDCWERGWERVADTVARHNAEFWWLNNGDLTDGDHHNTHQIVSRDSVPEREIVRRILDVPLALGPKHVFLVRGTESHVGPGGASEESIGRALSDDWPVYMNGDQASWWHLMMECEGVFLDFLHHGRTGYRPWTHWNATNLLAAQIVMERLNSDERIPDLAVRSHYHRHSDSHDAQKCRVIQTPAFQLATAYVHKRVPESLADIGMIWILVDNGHYEVFKDLHKPSRGPICQP